ncbi:hypothetical protein [Billgrantia desiderata]|jgi:hypothetical protein|uniref:hypothetical protein n=1 Tax=Billgrantia desiderata TaxID=52021 RepID=UPI00089E6166|nr:hypothetical protein [Halomonas desiderata]SEG29993.1 hypothetical protein SAMN04487953_12220 [Halomonas desiderata]
MAMKLSSKAKGQVAQTLSKLLLEQVGYRVVPLGVEELVKGAAYLSYDDYKQISLPDGLRKLPDFLVIDPDKKSSFLVEVKYMKRSNGSVLHAIHERLVEQLNYWPEMITLLLRSTPGHSKSKFHCDFIRTLGPGKELGQDAYCLIGEERWRGRWEFLRKHARPENVESYIGNDMWELLPELSANFDRFPEKRGGEDGHPMGTDTGDFVANALKNLAFSEDFD